MRKIIFLYLLLLGSLVISAQTLEIERDPFSSIKKTNPRAYNNALILGKHYPDSLILIGEKELFVQMNDFFTAETIIHRESYKYDSSLDYLLLIKETYSGEKKTVIVLLLILSFLSLTVADTFYICSRKWATILCLSAMVFNLVAIFVSIFLMSLSLTLCFGINFLIAGRLILYLSPFLPVVKKIYLFAGYYFVSVLATIVLL